jgi:hypothetical protein
MTARRCYERVGDPLPVLDAAPSRRIAGLVAIVKLEPLVPMAGGGQSCSRVFKLCCHEGCDLDFNHRGDHGRRRTEQSWVCSICGYQDGEHNYEAHTAEMRADSQFQEDLARGEYDDD